MQKVKSYKLKPSLKYTEVKPLEDMNSDWTFKSAPPSLVESSYVISEEELKKDSDLRYLDQLDALFERCGFISSAPPSWSPPKKQIKPEKLHIEPGRKAYQCKKCNKAGLYWGQASNGKFFLCEPDGYVHTCNL